jgi:hypothetical protein
MVDDFILFDDMQYTKRDWRNRNKIKTPKGSTWLTVPVKVKGKYRQKIKDTVINGSGWRQRHWKTIAQHYSKAAYFEEYKDIFEELYLSNEETFLSRINYRFLNTICDILGIKNKLSWSMDYIIADGKTERLVDLCKQVGGTEYISGPAAKAYIDSRLFDEENITLRYMDYSGYPEYNQLFPPFDHYVSVIDLIFNEGPNALRYMKTFRDKKISFNQTRT